MKPLQPTGYRESPYERPNQRWRCGRSEDPCAAGPDAGGRCPARLEALCQPQGETVDGELHYRCTRPALFGGPCEAGPGADGSCARPTPRHLPCRPRLTSSALLAGVTAAVAALTAAALALAFAGPWRLRALSPGPLAAPHDTIEGPSPGVPNCIACHANAERSPVSWVATAVWTRDPLADDARCLTCHFTSPDSRGRAALPHSTAPDRLALATAQTDPGGEGGGLASLLGAPPPLAGGRLACASCHRDHRGREHRLTTLADASCQVCHARRFASFGDGHAELGAVPRPLPGIAFDHRRHQGADHFGDTPFECVRCHVSDPAGGAMRLRPFDETCRGCHRQGLTDHHGYSIGYVELMLLQLPEMELPRDVDWPQDAAWGDDVIPPVMRLLLLGDDAALAPLEQMADEADGIPYDWLPDDDAPLYELVAAYKRLVADLASGDRQRLRERLARALDADPDEPRVAALADQIAGGRFAAAAWRARWLPGLAADGTGGQVGEGAPPDWPEPDQPAGFRVDAETGALRYRPTGHADLLFRALIEALPRPDQDADAHEEFRSAERQQLTAELVAERGGALHGACLRCHAAARPGGDPDWHAVGRGAGSTGYRRFDHRPHLTLLRDPGDCARCHELAEPGDEGNASRGFAPHRRELCAGCHHEAGAGDACLTCHDYHFLRP